MGGTGSGRWAQESKFECALTQQEVADILGVSKACVCKTEKRALAKLRNCGIMRAMLQAVKSERSESSRTALHYDSRRWFTDKFGSHWNAL